MCIRSKVLLLEAFYLFLCVLCAFCAFLCFCVHYVFWCVLCVWAKLPEIKLDVCMYMYVIGLCSISNAIKFIATEQLSY